MASQYSYQLRIPKDRIAVIIGKAGETKKELEKYTGTTIKIDSNEGEVTISGTDALCLYNSREVIKAIARGFNPELAVLLLKGDYSLEIIELRDFCKTKNDEKRLKGRVIGMEGKSRRTIEELTKVYISVYGKTIALIGEASFVPIAKRAIEALLSGSPHSNVYRWLERQRREMRRMYATGEIDEKYGEP